MQTPIHGRQCFTMIKWWQCIKPLWPMGLLSEERALLKRKMAREDIFEYIVRLHTSSIEQDIGKTTTLRVKLVTSCLQYVVLCGKFYLYLFFYQILIWTKIMNICNLNEPTLNHIGIRCISWMSLRSHMFHSFCLILVI